MDQRLKTMRILVVHPGALGDTLLALPVLVALKQHHEPATVDLIGHSSLVEVLPGRSVVDIMRPIDGPEFRSLFGDPLELPVPIQSFFGSFDIAVAWLDDHDERLRHCLRTLGIRNAVIRAPRLHEPGTRHATNRFGETLSDWDCAQPLPTTCLTPTVADLTAGAAWLARAGIPDRGVPVVAVHPGAGSPSKCWPPERYAEVIAALVQDGTAVVLVEGPADAQAVGDLQHAVAPLPVPRLVGGRLAAVVEVLSRCHAFLGNDSGLTQLAAGLGVPTIGIFGPTDPAVWAPRGDHVVTFRGGSDWLPISPGLVIEAVRQVVREPSASLAT